MALTRRIFLTAGGVVVIGGAAAAGGSLVFCARASSDSAALRLDRLDVAIGDMVAPDRIARAVRATVGVEACAADLADRPAILAAMQVECNVTRRGLIRTAVRDEFATGETIVADRFVVSRSEGLIAALRVSPAGYV